MIDETKIEMYEGRDEAGVPTMKTRTVYTGNKVPDYNEINKEAGEYYDKLYHYFNKD